MAIVDLDRYVPNFAISINGIKNGVLNEYVKSVQVSEELGMFATFSLLVSDQFDIQKQEFKWLDNELLKPGNKVSIQMGYVRTGLSKMIDGIITSISTSGFSPSDPPTLTVVGYEPDPDLLIQSPNIDDKTTSIQLKGSDIIKKLAEKSHLPFGISSNIKEYPTKVTKGSNSTYGAILKDRAKSIGYEFFVSKSKIYFVNPREKKSPTMTFEWDKNLIQFSPRINTSDLLTKVKITCTSTTSKKPITAEASTPDEDVLEDGVIKASEAYQKMHKGNQNISEINDQNFSSPEEAHVWAKAELNIKNDSLITGDGSIVGTPEMSVGQVIKLEKLGPNFSGLYYVTKVTHEISANGYTTSFSVRKNAIKRI